jgi:transposase
MPAMFGPRNPRHKKAMKQLQRAERIRAVTQLALEGRTQPEISAATGVSLRTVARILPAFRKDCLEKAEENNAE